MERETGVLNVDERSANEDVLFLRQLILDGQWDSALEFVEPLKEVREFDARAFRYTLNKYKFFELLCVLKLEPDSALHDNDYAVEEIVECLRELEQLAPSGEEFRRLCALLTLPRLADASEFRHWNPSSARVECYQKV